MKQIIFIIIILPLILWTTRGSGATSDLELLRNKLIGELMLAPVDEQKAGELISKIKDNGSWPGINYVDLSRIGYENVRHVSNIWTLALAYKKPGSKYYENQKLLNVIQAAIDFWTKNDFIAANWHTNEISNPQQLTHILLVLDAALSAKQTADLSILAKRANLDAWGARPGGDFIKIAGIMAEMALFQRDESQLKRAVTAMAAQIKITSGLGIKPDLGFHHRTDRVTSILTYGTNYAETFADWAVRLDGTSYQFPQESMKLIIDYYLDGICKSMVHAWYKAPGIINRDMSRKGTLAPVDARLPQKLLMVSDYRKQELENIVKIRKGEQAPNLTYNKFFWHSEYSIHQRPGYYTTVRMFSDRNFTMEAPHNEESLKMHHYADGANFISITGKEYYDIFPVWDWQKIPGTTVVQRPALPPWSEIVKKGKTSFVGAVSDGIYGASAFDFASPHDPLTARKSWFFFDSEYVCLGTGIQSSAEFNVTTAINQCLLNGEVIVKDKNGKKILEKGDHQLSNISWVIHDGIGYVFPKPASISLNNRAYSGRWSSIMNTTRSLASDQETKELFSLWIDHGIKPTNSSYEYIVIPGINPSVVDPEAVMSRVKILANTQKLQAVQQIGLGLTQIVFYEPGSIQLTDELKITSFQPGLIMIQTSGNKIDKITVADPTRNLPNFHLSVTELVSGSGSSWKTQWNKKNQSSDIVIDLPKGDDRGKSQTIINNTFEPQGKNNKLNPSKQHVKDNVLMVGQHYVGEHYGGGIVIWVDETKTHGIIAATEDQNDGIQWRNGASKKSRHYGDHGDRVVNSRGDGIGAGQMNTGIIIALLTEDDISGNFAAKVCANCQLGGYGDWYLPSKSELNLMYQLKDMIGGFNNDMYWSSTEFNVGFAWGQNFKGYGGQFNQNKSSEYAVRCVRKF